ncbi:hypothetical protein [Agreia sp. COWG]|uniref:hypothetical protein n=1 Tax=Agreia sp. COWG TaxID=2773266 RepID=UPI0019272794|nr:hypothetical protein [Agreia sp. COWG]CAD6009661.1 conserved protein of unknown function [Agreia sp. COWG]
MDRRVGRRGFSASQILLAWCAAVLLLIGVFGAGVVVLNSSVFSASGFVTTYLQTLGSKDVNGALSMPGVELPDGLTPDSIGAALLRRETLSTISNIEIDKDTDVGNGIHQVAVRYTLGGADRESERSRSDFVVEHTGTSYGVFGQWRFKESPVATMSLAVTNATSVTVGTRMLEASDLGAADGAFGAGARFTVLVPALVVMKHESHYLSSKTEAVTLASPGTTESGVVKAEPNALFTKAVSEQMTSFLDDCASQKSLFPVGCPFSKPVSDRIVDEPSWSIVKYPQVQIVAGPASWLVAPNLGTAHVEVQVKSLFDGTVSATSEDVPFSLNYAITLDADEQITFAART